MKNVSLSNYLSETKTVFYRSRVRVSPTRNEDIEIWPQIVRVVHNWLEEKEGDREQKNLDNFLTSLTDDIEKISENDPRTQETCWVSSSFADGTFEEETGCSYIKTKAMFRDRTFPDYWAMEYVEKDSTKWYRRWITDVGITSSKGNSYIVNVRVSVADDPAFLIDIPDLPPRNTPRFIKDLLDIPNCLTSSGNCILSSSPKVLNGRDMDWFVRLLESNARSLPIIVISAIRDAAGEYPIDPGRIANNLKGSASVYTIDNNEYETRIAYQRYFGFGKSGYEYRINSGCMRVFFPGVDLNDPEGSRRHHFFTQESLEGTDQRRLSNDICGAVTRMYRRQPNEALDPQSIDIISGIIKREQLERQFHELESQRKKESVGAIDLSGLHTEEELKAAVEEISRQYEERIKDDTAFYTDYIAHLENEQQKISSDADTIELQAQVDSLIAEKRHLTSSNSAKDHAIETLRLKKEAAEYDAERIRGQIEFIGQLNKFPKTADEALMFAEMAFAERLVVHERAHESARSFSANGAADEVFDILRCMAISLWPKYFVEEDSSTKAGEQFKDETGYEIAFSESGATNKDGRLARMRSIEYRGKLIDISPHVKGKTGKRDSLLRVHFYVDRNAGQIVIGYCGGHMETAGTRHIR